LTLSNYIEKGVFQFEVFYLRLDKKEVEP